MNNVIYCQIFVSLKVVLWQFSSPHFLAVNADRRLHLPKKARFRSCHSGELIIIYYFYLKGVPLFCCTVKLNYSSHPVRYIAFPDTKHCRHKAQVTHPRGTHLTWQIKYWRWKVYGFSTQSRSLFIQMWFWKRFSFFLSFKRLIS